jgi:hypothetical protein
MSFEVVYKYYDQIKDSFDYDRSNPSTFKKVYGKIEDDYPLDRLAGNIYQQMARRDIFIYDVEIYEFAKKKISFKQNKVDLIIKNKRFSPKTGTLEDIDVVETSENNCNLQPSPPALTHNNNVMPQELPAVNLAPPISRSQNVGQNLAPVGPKPRRVIKMVVFDPPNPKERAKFPYKFTPSKKYPVYKERISPTGIGMIIETVDDLNNPVSVSDELFATEDMNLIGDDEAGFSESKSGLSDKTLNWSGVVKGDVPKLR